MQESQLAQSSHVIGTGLSGLLGTKVVELLSDSFQFENIDLSHPTHPTDITNADQVMAVISSSPAEVVLHFAAYTDVNGAWQQRGDKNGAAYLVNVVGTQNIVNAAARTGKHLVHISTAYVFDGEKKEPYTEDDEMKPIEWYGQTKAWAEQAVQDSAGSWTILRIDQPFRSDPYTKLDVVHKIIAKLRQGNLPPQFGNHWIGPTFIDDFAEVVRWAINERKQGLFHASSGESWTDYDFALAVQKALHLPGDIQKGDLDAYLAKSDRPYQRNTALSTEKLRQAMEGLGVKQLPILEALRLVTFDPGATV